MRRVFAELISPEVLAAPATLDLLDRFELQTLVAVPPGAETQDLGAALADVAARGAGLGVWPLMSDAAGYWPGDDNLDAFEARVDTVLAFARDAGAEVRTVVFDLEPPLAVSRRLFEGEAGRVVVAEVFRALRPASRRGRAGARRRLEALASRLRGEGLETFATVLPPVVLDGAARGLWQAIFRTQVGAAFDRVCPMLYTSMMAAALPSGRLERARGLAGALGAQAVASWGGRAAAGLGLAGPGKLEGERVLPDPAALAADVATLSGLGIQDLALFSLEGVLGREDPEAWLRAFAHTPPGSPRLGAWPLLVRVGALPSTLVRILPERL